MPRKKKAEVTAEQPDGNVRGTGRTYKELAATPDHGLFIVMYDHQVPMIRMYLEKQGRPTNAVRCTDIGRVLGNPDCIRGMRRSSIKIDHFVHECDPRAFKRLCALLDRLRG